MMLFEMLVLVQEGKLACARFPHDVGMMLLVEMLAFPHNGMMLFEMLVQEGKLAHTSFPPQWNDVV
jgi:hypothetical protein